MVKDVTEGLAGRELRVQYLAGLPSSLSRRGYVLDVARESSTPIPTDLDYGRKVALGKLIGYEGSALEHRTLEQVLNTESVSAVKTLQAAAATGVPVLRITEGNAATEIPKLSGYSLEAVGEVRDAVGARMEVTIPERPVSHAQYAGVEGYILFNPADGTGVYRLDASLNGGESSGKSSASGPGGGCPNCTEAGTATGSFVRFSDGDWSERFTDLALPAPGLPIAFTRIYRSGSSNNGALGFGWQHSYGMRLSPEADGSLTYLTDDNRQLKLAKAATANTWTAPAGWYLTLSKDASGYRMRFKDGLVQAFDLGGRLAYIEEPNGNRVILGYGASGQLETITDSTGRVALRLGYDTAGKLSTITDAAGRQVRFAHDGDDLVAATDVLGQTERYSYSSSHKLVSRTDRNGSVWTELYDEDGRWSGMVDPDGNGNRVLYDQLARRAVLIDRTGRATSWEWNTAGNPVAVTDPTGETRRMSWDSAMNKTAESDGRGASWSYGYDAKRNLTSRKDPAGTTITYRYEPSFSRLTYQSGPGGSTSNTYDTKGNLQTTRDGPGNTTSYTYGIRGLPETITQPGSAVTRLGYDAQGNLETLTDPEGGETRLGYDAAGHLLTITDANAKTRTLETDAAGRVLAMLDAQGSRTSFTYDALGNRLTSTDAAGNVTRFGYDKLGRLISMTDALGNVSRTEYDAEGRVLARIDARGSRTEYVYDAAGRLSQTRGPDGALVSYGYCADAGASTCASGSCGGGSGQACEVVDPLGNATKVDHDALGRETSRTDPLGFVRSQYFDAWSRLTSATDENGNKTSYSYDSANRLTRVGDPIAAVSYGYDGRGNRTSVTMTGSTTSFGYDKANRLVSETNPSGKVTSYTYDAAGNRATKTDGNGAVTSYSYDGNRRLETAGFEDGTKYEYDYDSRGNRTLEKSETHERRLHYDPLNRIERVEDVTLGKSIEYSYDSAGNRRSMSVDGLTTSYRYDKASRLIEVTEPDGEVVRLSYDLAGNRRTMSLGNGVVASYSYDEGGRLNAIVYSDPSGRVLRSFRYEMDAVGNRLAKSFADGTQEIYSYDAGNRLTKAYYSATGREVTYGLDHRGNRVSLTEKVGATTRTESYTNNAFNQVLSRSVAGVATSFGYDGNGNLVSETQGTSVSSYIYDLDNRLRGIALPSGASDSFEYDANGLRTLKADSGGTTRYLLDGPSVVAEYDEGGSRKAFYSNNPQRIDEVFSATVIFNGLLTKVYPLTDGLGSVYALVDRNGVVARTNSYDVYGARISPGTGPQLAMGFTGREHDESGLNYHRDRYLMSEVGRWAQADGLGMVDGPNRYQYVLANPTGLGDPSGKNASMGFAQVIGSIASDIWAEAGLSHMEAAIDEPEDVDYMNDRFMYGASMFFGSILIDLLASQSCDPELLFGLLDTLDASAPGVVMAGNRWGRRGSPAHRAVIGRAEQRLTTMRGWRTVSGGSLPEKAVDVAGGRKMYPDLVMEKGNKLIAIQVGRQTKGGLPVAREARNLVKLRGTGKCEHVFFLHY